MIAKRNAFGFIMEGELEPSLNGSYAQLSEALTGLPKGYVRRDGHTKKFL